MDSASTQTPAPTSSGPNRFMGRAAITVALALSLGAVPAFAVNKDMVELQTQIQTLQEAVARLQQSNDERMGVLKDLVQQSADSVNKMSLSVDTLQKQVRTQQESMGAKLDQAAGQSQALSDSIDEIRARLNRLDKAMQEIQTQQQAINAGLQNLSSAQITPGQAMVATPPPGLPPAPSSLTPPTQSAAPGARRGKPAPGTPLSVLATGPAPVATVSSTPAAPPASDLYKTALSDYMGAKYPLASSEFGEVIRLYPDDALAGNSFYYMGEIDYRAGKYAASAKDYDHVLEQFPDSAKVPVSHLHKGMALFELKQNDAGIRELRALITRFPNTPEATQARSKLNGLGVPIVPRTR